MSLLSSFDIGATGLSAQALRLNLTASNIANVESVSGPDGRTYRARHVEFSAINNLDRDVLQQRFFELSK